MRRAAAFLLAFLGLLPPAHAVGSAAHERLRGLVEAVYGLEYAEARAQVEAFERLEPGHPYAPLGRAIILWVRYVYGTERNDEELSGRMEPLVAEALRSAERWNEEKPDDPDGWLALGAAHGLAARGDMVHRRWLRAYFSGRAAIRAVKKAVRLDPGLHDAYLGLGAFDYYTATVPRLVRPLSWLLFRGNRGRGVKRLDLAAEKGRYMSLAAKLLLAEIRLRDRFGLRDPGRAAQILEEARREVPGSPMIHAGLVGAYYESGDLARAMATAGTFLERIENGEFPEVQRAKARFFLGTLHWAAGRPEEALRQMRAAAGARYAGRPSRWASWAMVRAGQYCDLAGDREAALAFYRRAAEAGVPWGYEEAARRGLKDPFRQEPGERFKIWPDPEG